MKRLIVFLTLIVAALPAYAQIVCGPYAPFGRSQNADGTWTIGTNASCQFPDPNPWAHSYTFTFPSTITYLDGVSMQFVGGATAYIQGHSDRIGRYGIRLVTVDSASLVDQAGNVYPLTETKFGTAPFQLDEWMSTTPLASDTLYTFAAAGTDPYPNKAEDVLVIYAVYQQVQPTSSGGDD